MTTTKHPTGATLNLGGDAWAHPDLEAHLTPTDTVHLFKGNPRRGDQEAITASIRDLGLYRTLIAQRSTGHILAGNHTYRALLDLGAEKVPVTWVDVDDTRAAAIVARDNRTSELGGYDDADLLALLTSDPEVLALSGYGEDDVRALLGAADRPESADHLRDTEDRYTEQYGVIVMCGSSAEQERVYGQLTEQGLRVRVVTV